MKKFTVELFAHCRSVIPLKVVEFNNVNDARTLMESLRDKRVPAQVHSHGKHAKLICVNHPNPYDRRDDWNQAENDGWV